MTSTKLTLALVILLLTFQAPESFAQQKVNYDVRFADTVLSVRRQKTQPVIVEIPVNATQVVQKELDSFQLQLEVDETKTTMPRSGYELNPSTVLFQTIQKDKHLTYLKVYPDSVTDRERLIVLNIKTIPKTGSPDAATNLAKSNQTLVIRVMSYNADSLNGYNYLGYIGTNFDLVDGIKASRLFFATNVFVPRYGEGLGLYVSLYGNRTFTSTDTTQNFIYTTRFRQVDDTTSFRYRNSATVVRSQVFDNLGAVVNPMVPLWIASRRNNVIQLYFTPYIEFVWRRGTITANFNDVTFLDSSRTEGVIATTLDAPVRISSNFNQFDFYFGGGFAAVHETPSISVRLFLNIAGQASYVPLPGSDNLIQTTYDNLPTTFAFVGRLWVTEPRSGVTLQGEVLNNTKRSQPYYGVTLSKAFHLANLAAFFQPLTSRN